MLGLLLTCVCVCGGGNSPGSSQSVHTQAMACLSTCMPSRSGHDLCSINSAKKLVEVIIPLSDFLQLLLPYKLGNAPKIKSTLFGKSNGIPLRQMYHKTQNQKSSLQSSLKKKKNYLTWYKDG